jgi:serralysin
VAAGDVDADGRADLVTGAGAGGASHVRVLSRAPDASLGELASFLAYPIGFTGGVTVAAGDVDGDGRADIITGTGPGGASHVRVFRWNPDGSLTELASFLAYPPGFIGGVFVAAGDVDDDGRADVITGAGLGGGSHVEVFSGADGSLRRSFFAYDPGLLSGVRVAASDIDGDGRADIITGPGPGGGPEVRVFGGATGGLLLSLFAYDPGLTTGLFVAGFGP